MSSGFVSGGTVDAPIERSDEWLAAQKEIEANRQRKLDEQARLSSGKSLFETLEANKAAKQEAFEEANKLKNQFRALDQDEIEFLDSVMESTRREEEKVKRETREGLEVFRRQQEEQDKISRRHSGGELAEEVNEESWTAGVGRKRKRTKEKEVLKGVKVRRGSTVEEKDKASKAAATVQKTNYDGDTSTKRETSRTESPTHSQKHEPVLVGEKLADPKIPSSTTKSSLVAYGSDSDD